jgi:glycoside/pentoside/hexuronide:cation symporter, GPH family
MHPDSKPLTLREKLAYGLGDCGANLIGQTQVTFLLFFYTEVMGIAAGAAGTILLASRFLDAINDPIVGALADRTTSRWGRYRPWILVSAIPLATALVLCYTIPDVGPTKKIMWAVVTYNLLMILYAANNIPYCALSGVMTDDSTERTSLASWRFVCAMAATLVVNTFTLDLVKYFGRDTEATGYRDTMVFWGTIAVICFAITFAFTRERIGPSPQQHSSLRQDLSDLIHSGPWIALFLLAVLIHIQLALRGGTMLYYFTHFVRRQDPIGYFSPFGLFNGVGLIVVMIGVVLAKPLSERFGKRNTIQASLFLSAIFMALFAAVPRDALSQLFLLQVLMQLSFGPSIPLLWTMMADVADYAEWKMNRRSTALAFASIVFGLKLGSGIGGWLSGKWLDYVGYSPSGSQSLAASRGIVALISVLPAAALLIGCFVLFFYRIDDRLDEQIKGDLRERRRQLSED